MRYSLIDNLNGNNPLAYFFIISDSGLIYLSQPLTNNLNQVDRYQVGVILFSSIYTVLAHISFQIFGGICQEYNFSLLGHR